MGRRFVIVWGGQLVSMVGSTLTGFGLLVQMYFDTGEILWLAVLTLAGAVPPMVAAPLMGVVDRHDRRRVLIAADAAAAAITLALLGLLLVTDLTPGIAVTIAVLHAFVLPFQQSAYLALIPALVGDGDLGRANGLVQLAPSVATVVGPGLAGVLIATVGFETVLAIDLVTFAIAMAALTTVRVAARPKQRLDPAAGTPTGTPTDTDTGTDTVSLRAAVRWLRTHLPSVGYLLALLSLVNLSLGIFNVVVIARATDLGGEAGSGLPSTAGGIAMVVTSLAVSAFGIPRRRIKTVGVTTLVYGALLVAASGWANLAWFVVLSGIAIGMIGIIQPALNTVFQEHLPDAMLGRVFGLRIAIGRGATPIGNLLAIPLASWSVAGSIAIAGLGVALSGAIVTSARFLTPLDRSDS